jgi:hypothetical protein
MYVITKRNIFFDMNFVKLTCRGYLKRALEGTKFVHDGFPTASNTSRDRVMNLFRG